MLAKNIIYKIRKKYDIHSIFKNTRRYFSNNNNEGSMLHGLSEGTIYGRKNGEIVDVSDLSENCEIELLLSPTPNGHKISILLEELDIEYKVRCIDLSGEQYQEDFLTHSPNAKIPVIIDHSNNFSIFESGAILTYLCEKYDKDNKFYFNNNDTADWINDTDKFKKRSEIMQWLMWQKANLGPMVGQAITFNRFVKQPIETIQYSIHRYEKESRRLFEVCDKQIGNKQFICTDDEPSIADFAIFPWIRAHRMAKVSIDGLLNIENYLIRMKKRVGVKKGLSVGFVNTPLGREMGMRYSNDQRMTAEQKEAFLEGGSKFLHEKAEELSK